MDLLVGLDLRVPLVLAGGSGSGDGSFHHLPPGPGHPSLHTRLLAQEEDQVRHQMYPEVHDYQLPTFLRRQTD